MLSYKYLIPFFTVYITAGDSSFSLQREDYVFALQVSEGKLAPVNTLFSSWWCGASMGKIHQVVLSSIPLNLTWSINSYPEEPTLLTFR